MGLYTVGSIGNVSNQMSEAMYKACRMEWRDVTDHNKMEMEMKRQDRSVIIWNTGITKVWR
jgi:hypothetical protein